MIVGHERAGPCPRPRSAIRELQQISDAALASLVDGRAARRAARSHRRDPKLERHRRLPAPRRGPGRSSWRGPRRASRRRSSAACESRVGKGFAGRISRGAELDRDRGRRPRRDPQPDLRIKGIRSLLGVPLLVEGQVIGVLRVGTLTPRIFTDDDHSLLQLAADRAALAIERARFYEQRRGVEALQRALLPGPPPRRSPGSSSRRGRYAAVGHSIGGDWYDVFRLGGGRIGLVIGDVMGHGVAAAALMAELRTALRAYALDGHPPAEVAERMNRLLAPSAPHDDDHARLPRPRPRDRVGERRVRRARAPAGDRPRRFDALPRVRRRPAGRRVQRHDLPRAPFRDGRPAPRSCSSPTAPSRSAGSRSTAGWSACAGPRPPGAGGRGTTRHGDRGHGEVTSGRSNDDLAVLAVHLAELPDRLRTSRRGARGARRDAPHAAPLARAPRRRRGRGLRHHAGGPGGVRQRHRARVCAGPGRLRRRRLPRGRRGRHRRDPRPLPLARGSRAPSAGAACR